MQLIVPESTLSAEYGDYLGWSTDATLVYADGDHGVQPVCMGIEHGDMIEAPYVSIVDMERRDYAVLVCYGKYRTIVYYLISLLFMSRTIV